METVLLDFLNDQGRDFLFHREGSVVVLRRFSPSNVNLVYMDQVANFLYKHHVSLDLAEALYLANKKVGTISHDAAQTDFGKYVFDKRIQVCDALDERDMSPEVKGWFCSFAPGYSRDGNTAIVRSYFGPFVMHPTIVTYLLRHDGSKWRVEWREVYFFP